MSVIFRRTAMFGIGAALQAIWVGLASCPGQSASRRRGGTGTVA